jgi:peptide/nickel transport system ATP-binding protein
MDEQLTLNVEHLRSSFFTLRGEVKVVDDVSLAVPKGKIVGIVGESGCGKSMTAKSIVGILKYPGRVVDGSIRLDGQELVDLPGRAMRQIRGRDISMIFQEPMTSLNPVVKAGRQVQEALLLHRSVSRAEARREVLEIFRTVGISEPEKRYDSYPFQLSGGLRQRVMIAMAMICRPKLLIADEPTTALDVTIEAQILKLMKDLSRDTGMSIILITHNLGVIAELCDFVHVMYAGKIVEQADTFTLFDRPRHPYTQGLMAAVIRLDRDVERLQTIPGVVPNLLHLPAGCAFSNRCPYATEQCRTQPPVLRDVGGGHLVRCFREEIDE